MKSYNSKQLFYSLFVLALTTALAETVKSLIETSKYNEFITLGFISIAAIVIVILDMVEKKRISSGKSQKSIAIRSSKFISDFYKRIKQYSKKEKWSIHEEEIVKDINSISRHLLLIGEYKVRFLLGNIIYNNSKNELYRLSALIDEIGWTSVMMGKKKSIDYFLEAVKPIDSKIKEYDQVYQLTSHDVDDHSLKLLYLYARAYRHLGATPHVDINDRKTYTDKGLAIVCFLENINPLPKCISKNSLLNMRTGLYYGIAETNYKAFTKRKNKSNSDAMGLLIKAFEFNELAKNNAADFTNKHRYIKCLLLENEIYVAKKSIDEAMGSIKAYENEKTITAFLALNQITFDKNLKTVEDLLNHSIYIDESYETFLEEKLRTWRKQDEK